jgi:hypothetical protein
MAQSWWARYVVVATQKDNKNRQGTNELRFVLFISATFASGAATSLVMWREIVVNIPVSLCCHGTWYVLPSSATRNARLWSYASRNLSYFGVCSICLMSLSDIMLRNISSHVHVAKCPIRGRHALPCRQWWEGLSLHLMWTLSPSESYLNFSSYLTGNEDRPVNAVCCGQNAEILTLKLVVN